MSRLLDALGIALGAVALALALPTDFLPQGWGVLGWLVLIPVFRWTRSGGPLASALGGAAFFFVFSLLSCSWLWGFHPLAYPIVLVIMAPCYAGAFWVSHLLWKAFPRHGLWAQAALWVVFEWSRTLWWLAFPYGSLAATQAYHPLLIQSADLVGTHGLTFVMALVAASIVLLGERRLPPVQGGIAAALVLVLASYGGWRLAEPDRGRAWTVALVQNAQDPWRSGKTPHESSLLYQANLETLIGLSRTALEQEPEAVVWPETAFIPGISWHTRFREDPLRWQQVRQLQDFLAEAKTPFVIGNNEGVLAPDGETRWDYNAALAWNDGWSDPYRKMRLVPFTEYLPGREWIPVVGEFLEANGSHFWQPGERPVTLTLGEVTVGTPICYEDAFSGVARDLALLGAKVLVNLTNDAWSSGTASREQHLGLALFRAVETRMPLVRAANDGVTAAISSRGQVVARLPVGTREVLLTRVNLGDGRPTLYTTTGDLFPLILFLGLIFVAVGRKLHIKIDKGSNL